MKKLYLLFALVYALSFYAKTERNVITERISLEDYLDYTTDVFKSLCHQYECLHKSHNYNPTLFSESNAMVDYINECIKAPTEECRRLFSGELNKKEFLNFTTPGSKNVFKMIKYMVKSKTAQKITLQDYLEYLQDIFRSLANRINSYRQNQSLFCPIRAEAQKMVDYINLWLEVPAQEGIQAFKIEIERENILAFTTEGSKKVFMAMKNIVESKK